MRVSVKHNPQMSTGYRLEQLAAAFDRVMHPRDWQAPIRSVIPAEERELVAKAVLWFTDTAPEFRAVPGESDRLMITAPGYRAGTDR